MCMDLIYIYIYHSIIYIGIVFIVSRSCAEQPICMDASPS